MPDIFDDKRPSVRISRVVRREVPARETWDDFPNAPQSEWDAISTPLSAAMPDMLTDDQMQRLSSAASMPNVLTEQQMARLSARGEFDDFPDDGVPMPATHLLARQYRREGGQAAQALSRGAIIQREAGQGLVKGETAADGSTTYTMQQVSQARPLSLSEKLAIVQAHRAQYEGIPIEQQNQNPAEARAQIIAATAADNNALENFSGAAADTMARIGTGLVGTVAPETANELNDGLMYTYDPDTKAAFAGQVVGNTLPLVPAMAAGPGGMAAMQNATAGLLGASQFGSVRADVANRRLQGQQISVGQELTAAALSAAAEFAFERVGVGSIQSVSKAALTGNVKNAVFQYAKAAGINASEEFLTQVAQNAVDKHVLGGKVGYFDDADKAALMGAVIGAGGSMAGSVIQRYGPHGKTIIENTPAAPAESTPVAERPSVTQTETTAQPAAARADPLAGATFDDAAKVIDPNDVRTLPEPAQEEAPAVKAEKRLYEDGELSDRNEAMNVAKARAAVLDSPVYIVPTETGYMLDQRRPSRGLGMVVNPDGSSSSIADATEGRPAAPAQERRKQTPEGQKFSQSEPEYVKAKTAIRAKDFEPGTLVHGGILEDAATILRNGIQPSQLSGRVDAERINDQRKATTAAAYAGKGGKGTPVLFELDPSVTARDSDGGQNAVEAFSRGTNGVRAADVVAVHMPDGRRLTLAEAAIEGVKLSGGKDMSTITPPPPEPGLPKPPGEARDWSFNVLKTWAKDKGYKVGTAENFGTLWRQMRTQRAEALIPERPSLPPTSRDWTFKQMRYWAEQNGYDSTGVTGTMTLRKAIAQQRAAAVREARGLPPRPARKPAEVVQESMPAVEKSIKKAAPIEGTVYKRHVHRLIEEIITPISSRIRDISPRMFGRLMQMEFNTGVARENLKRELTPKAEAITEALGGKGSEKYAAFKADVLNGNFDAAAARLPDSVREDFAAFGTTFRNLLDQQKAAGVKIGDLGENYWPRFIKDYDAFHKLYGDDMGRFEEAFDLARRIKGRLLTAEEKAKVANDVIQGFGPRKPGSYGPANARERNIETLTDEQVEHYIDPFEAALRYVDNATYAAERSKFLGRNHELDNLEHTIGRIVQAETDAGRLSPDQQQELEHLLKVRFTADMLTMSRPARVVKQMMYLVSLGQFRNAVNQILDVATTASEHGIGPALKAFGSSVKSSVADTWLGRTLKLTPNDWHVMMEDIGVHDHGEEFKDVGKIARATDKILTFTQFKRLDRIGKETRLNAARIAFEKAAREGGETMRRLERDYKPVFGDRWHGIVDSLKEGKQTLDVNELLMLDVAKVQPINQSQMPERYLTADYGRLMYSMKTFMLNQMDMVRRDIVRKLATPGQRKEGLQRLGSLVLLTALIGLGKEFLQDLIRGKKLDADTIPDKSVNSVLGLVGLNRYTLDQSWTNSPFDAAANMILPPTTPWENLWKDVTTFGDGSGFRSIQNIPVIGDLLYYRFGKGATLDEEKAAKDYRRKLNDVRREAYLARQSGDRSKARYLLGVYNDRRKDGPGDGRKSPLTFDDLSKPPPGSAERKAELAAKKQKERVN